MDWYVCSVWSGHLVCTSVSLTILRSTIVANAFSSNLETHKSQNFHMAAPRWVAPPMHFTWSHHFPPSVPYPFILDQCLKGDRWTTLFLRNSIVAMDLENLQTHKIWIILRGETYVSINLFASAHLLLYRFKYTKLLQISWYCFPKNFFGKFLFLQISKI